MSGKTRNTLGSDPEETNPAAQRLRLAAWWREWDLHGSLADADENDAPRAGLTVTGGPSLSMSEGELKAPRNMTPPAVGQIRLLPSRGDTCCARPIFVAVLEPVNGGAAFLCAPFSRFSVPAVPGEFLTGRKEPAVRVLSVWNVRRLPVHVLSEGWFADALDREMMRDARTLLRHLHDGQPLPEKLRSRVGPPLLHPADPRHEYLDAALEEMCCFEEDQPDAGKTRRENDPYPERTPLTLLKAAEDREKYDHPHTPPALSDPLDDET